MPRNVRRGSVRFCVLFAGFAKAGRRIPKNLQKVSRWIASLMQQYSNRKSVLLQAKPPPRFQIFVFSRRTTLWFWLRYIVPTCPKPVIGWRRGEAMFQDILGTTRRLKQGFPID